MLRRLVSPKQVMRNILFAIYPAQVSRCLVQGDNIKFPLLFAGSHLEPQYHWFACSRSEDKVFMQQRGTIKYGINCVCLEKVVISCKKL